MIRDTLRPKKPCRKSGLWRQESKDEFHEIPDEILDSQERPQCNHGTDMHARTRPLTLRASFRLLMLVAGACGVAFGGSPVAAQGNAPPAQLRACSPGGSAPRRMGAMEFQRMGSGLGFEGQVTVTDQLGLVRSDEPVRMTCTRGQISSVTNEGEGVYTASVTPDEAGTGEYEVTASIDRRPESVTRTALVLAEVRAHWDQPRKVRGLVNTAGWEDSISITPDGEWLFLVYSPVSISCFWGSPDACLQAVGPWTAPHRPDFIGIERIAPDGTVANTCLGIPPQDMPWNLPPFTTYGFKRQTDGSFAEPFVIGVPGSGGCILPGGLNAYPRADGSAHLLFSWNEFDSNGIQFAVAELPALGEFFALGQWEGVYGLDGRVENKQLNVLPIPDGVVGLGFNVHGFMDSEGSIDHLWFDDEHNSWNLFVVSLQPGGSYPAGPWSPPVSAPIPLLTGNEQAMPFFNGQHLSIRDQWAIVSARFLGGPGSSPLDPGLWEPYQVDLAGDPGAATQVGGIFIVAEPTRTDPDLTHDGKEYLYFNYAVLTPANTYDVRVGFVSARDCPWDLDSSGDVGVSDFLLLLAQWGADPGGPPDFDGDGNVGVADFLDLLAYWGPCP